MRFNYWNLVRARGVLVLWGKFVFLQLSLLEIWVLTSKHTLGVLEKKSHISVYCYCDNAMVKSYLSVLMPIMVPQYFPQENCISWVRMIKLLFIVHNLQEMLSIDLNSIPCYTDIFSLHSHTFFFFKEFILVSSLLTFVSERDVSNIDVNSCINILLK